MKRYDANEVQEKIEYAKEACKFFNRNGNEHMVSWDANKENGLDWIAVRGSRLGERCEHVMIIEPIKEPEMFHEVGE